MQQCNIFKKKGYKEKEIYKFPLGNSHKHILMHNALKEKFAVSGSSK